MPHHSHIVPTEIPKACPDLKALKWKLAALRDLVPVVTCSLIGKLSQRSPPAPWENFRTHSYCGWFATFLYPFPKMTSGSPKPSEGDVTTQKSTPFREPASVLGWEESLGIIWSSNSHEGVMPGRIRTPNGRKMSFNSNDLQPRGSERDLPQPQSSKSQEHVRFFTFHFCTTANPSLWYWMDKLMCHKTMMEK